MTSLSSVPGEKLFEATMCCFSYYNSTIACFFAVSREKKKFFVSFSGNRFNGNYLNREPAKGRFPRNLLRTLLVFFRRHGILLHSFDFN